MFISRKMIIIFFTITALTFSNCTTTTAEIPVAGFGPTWKLLSHDQKHQFIAGYLHALDDSHQMTDIAVQYIEEDPRRALESLKSIRKLQNISGLTPDIVVSTLDRIYAEPENSSLALSRAVTAVRSLR